MKTTTNKWKPPILKSSFLKMNNWQKQEEKEEQEIKKSQNISIWYHINI